ncbi:MAG: hypothetical protein LCH91_17535 [Bacteroidetes bacterium]|nr:hypothetical protein [Bacteroidota bacterium]
MILTWKKCLTYEQARNYRNIIYLHEWYDKPFYWGKAHKSFFGGHMREMAGFRASGRYNVGYRHWIEGCLKHGASLYITEIDQNGEYTIDEVENYLIANYPSEMNRKPLKSAKIINLTHFGEVPNSLFKSV